MKALQTLHNLRFRPAGLITSGARLTLLALMTGLVVLGQAWHVAHRYGQHAAARPQRPAAVNPQPYNHASELAPKP